MLICIMKWQTSWKVINNSNESNIRQMRVFFLSCQSADRRWKGNDEIAKCLRCEQQLDSTRLSFCLKCCRRCRYCIALRWTCRDHCCETALLPGVSWMTQRGNYMVVSAFDLDFAYCYPPPVCTHSKHTRSRVLRLLKKLVSAYFPLVTTLSETYNYILVCKSSEGRFYF